MKRIRALDSELGYRDREGRTGWQKSEIKVNESESPATRLSDFTCDHFRKLCLPAIPDLCLMLHRYQHVTVPCALLHFLGIRANVLNEVNVCSSARVEIDFALSRLLLEASLLSVGVNRPCRLSAYVEQGIFGHLAEV
ncbi:MAG: hypothetical protein QGF00_33130 [Planctomycetota bacterium]|jgi:hypothetical protein|nr:hypothetical protein [Planctomycetota bacterium]MDP7254486.1 hypothetical protein [Planctomycetota bacterium]